MPKDAKILCPLMGSECIEDGAIKDGELVKCRFWVHIQGMDPQTGKTVSNGDCAFCWTPMLLIENSQQQRQTGAAVESFRNEMVKANDTNVQVLLAGNNNMRLISDTN